MTEPLVKRCGSSSKPTVLITGCSDDGLGAAMAREFLARGFFVYATARSLVKMASLADLSDNIELFELDICSDESIARCTKHLHALDLLVNNAGITYAMPFTDTSMAKIRTVFEINVFGHLALTQALLPLLRKSKRALIVNHTSIGADRGTPFQSSYNASKAAMMMFSDVQRLELAPFGIQVVNLKTGGVKGTNLVNTIQAHQEQLPSDSIFALAKQEVEKSIRLEWAQGQGMDPQIWAKNVVNDLMKKHPPQIVRRGQAASLSRWTNMLPQSWLDSLFKNLTGFTAVEAALERAL